MIGLGTIVNAAAIAVGGLLGMTVGKGLKPRLRDTLNTALGLSVIFIGASGTLSRMLTVKDGGFGTQGEMMMILSLVLGGLVGELVNIEGGCERFGEWLKKKTNNGGDSRFVTGFVNASLTACIGVMAIIGSINDGLAGDPSILYMKSVLDLVMVAVMSASLGVGCIFSVIPVVLLQGSVTLLAGLVAPVMTEAALADLSLVGSVLIFGIGVNLAFSDVMHYHIKVGNLLPSIVFAVIFSFLPFL